MIGEVKTHVSAMHVRIDGAARAQARAAATAAHYVKNLVTRCSLRIILAGKYFIWPFNLYATALTESMEYFYV